MCGCGCVCIYIYIVREGVHIYIYIYIYMTREFISIYLYTTQRRSSFIGTNRITGAKSKSECRTIVKDPC